MSANANWRRQAVALATAMSLLAGCVQANSSCPPTISYDRTTLAEVANELERLGPNSATARLIADYDVLRAQVRACR